VTKSMLSRVFWEERVRRLGGWRLLARWEKKNRPERKEGKGTGMGGPSGRREDCSSTSQAQQYPNHCACEGKSRQVYGAIL